MKTELSNKEIEKIQAIIIEKIVNDKSADEKELNKLLDKLGALKQ